MSTDVELTAKFESMMHSIDVPSVPLAQIQERMTHVHMPALKPRQSRRFAVAAAVAAAAVLSIVPLVSPAVMQGLEARYRAALQALGGIAPPPAPMPIISKLQTQSKAVTLAEAQTLVDFKITQPSGLPQDTLNTKIVVSPTGIYSKETHTWSVGQNELTFWYRRAHGQEFGISADRYDPHAEPLGRYVFEARDPSPAGKPVLIKHERFAWRNGDQLTYAVTSRQLTAREILAIQSAMHGTPIALRALHTPDHSSTNTLHIITKP